MENIEASVVVLRKLAGEWKDYAVKHPSFDPLRETLKSFRQKVTTLNVFHVVIDGNLSIYVKARNPYNYIYHQAAFPTRGLFLH